MSAILLVLLCLLSLVVVPSFPSYVSELPGDILQNAMVVSYVRIFIAFLRSGVEISCDNSRSHHAQSLLRLVGDMPIEVKLAPEDFFFTSLSLDHRTCPFYSFPTNLLQVFVSRDDMAFECCECRDLVKCFPNAFWSR